MKKLIGIWIVLIVLILFIIFDYISYPNLKKYKKEIYKYGFYEIETVNSDTYDSLAECEYNKGIRFPLSNVKFAKLHCSNYFTSEKSLKKHHLEKLLLILNDSANYEWGELGTPEIHYFFTFYDDKNRCIGLTTIDLEGMAYSYPSLYRMKWGALNKMDEVRKIILEIENK